MMVRQGHRTGRQQGQEGLAALPWLAGGFCPLVTVCFPPSGTWEILAKVGTSEWMKEWSLCGRRGWVAQAQAIFWSGWDLLKSNVCPHLTVSHNSLNCDYSKKKRWSFLRWWFPLIAPWDMIPKAQPELQGDANHTVHCLSVGSEQGVGREGTSQPSSQTFHWEQPGKLAVSWKFSSTVYVADAFPNSPRWLRSSSSGFCSGEAVGGRTPPVSQGRAANPSCPCCLPVLCPCPSTALSGEPKPWYVWF